MAAKGRRATRMPPRKTLRSLGVEAPRLEPRTYVRVVASGESDSLGDVMLLQHEDKVLIAREDGKYVGGKRKYRVVGTAHLIAVYRLKTLAHTVVGGLASVLWFFIIAGGAFYLAVRFRLFLRSFWAIVRLVALLGGGYFLWRVTSEVLKWTEEEVGFWCTGTPYSPFVMRVPNSRLVVTYLRDAVHDARDEAGTWREQDETD